MHDGLGELDPVGDGAAGLAGQVVDGEPGLLGLLQDQGHEFGRGGETAEVVVDEEAGADPGPSRARAPGGGGTGGLHPDPHLGEVLAEPLGPVLEVLHVEVAQLQREMGQRHRLGAWLGAGLPEDGLAHACSQYLSSVSRPARSLSACQVSMLAIWLSSTSSSVISCSRHWSTGSSGTAPRTWL